MCLTALRTVKPDPCLANCTRLIRDTSVNLGLARISLSCSLVMSLIPCASALGTAPIGLHAVCRCWQHPAWDVVAAPPAQGCLPRVVPHDAAWWARAGCIPRGVVPLAFLRPAHGRLGAGIFLRVVPLAFSHPAHRRLVAPCYGIFPRKTSCYGWSPLSFLHPAHGRLGAPCYGIFPRKTSCCGSSGLLASRARSPRRAMPRDFSRARLLATGGLPFPSCTPRTIASARHATGFSRARLLAAGPLAFSPLAHGRLVAPCHGIFPAQDFLLRVVPPFLPAPRARSPRRAMLRDFPAQDFLLRVLWPSRLSRTVASSRHATGFFPRKTSCYGWHLFHGIFPHKTSCYGWCPLPSRIPRTVASSRHATGFSRARLLGTGGASCPLASRARSPRRAVPRDLPAQDFLVRVAPLSFLHPALGRLGAPCYGIFPRKTSCYGWSPLSFLHPAHGRLGAPCYGIFPRKTSCCGSSGLLASRARSPRRAMPRDFSRARLLATGGTSFTGFSRTRLLATGGASCPLASRARSPRRAVPRDLPAQDRLFAERPQRREASALSGFRTERLPRREASGLPHRKAPTRMGTPHYQLPSAEWADTSRQRELCP